MKLKKLEIHNLASIVDATIDFETVPLENSEVFLITGKTGSGKSTLLDGISLALYAKTPRLENSHMNGRVEETTTKAGKEKSIDIAINDERNMLRRGTYNGWAKLWFEGSNNVNYVATWEASRASKNPSGNFKAKHWEWKNLDTEEVLCKDKEIEAEIGKAIGLDFPQFCRTAMLAQGEFTKFLNSNDKEKSEILEKITGMDIYSKIGVKIFEKARNAEEQYRQQKSVADQVKVMTEEEREDQLAEQKRIEQEEAELLKLKAVDDKKLKWLESEATLQKQQLESEQHYAEALKVVESESFKNEEQTTKEWHQTKDARTWLSEYNKHKSIVEAEDKALAISVEEFKACAGGELWRGQQLKTMQQQLMQAEQYLKEESHRKVVYDNSSNILAQLDILIKNRKDGAEKSTLLKREESALAPLKEAYQQADEAMKMAVKQYEEAVKQLEIEEAALKEMGLQALRESKDDLMKRGGDLKQAQSSVHYLVASQGKLTEAKAQVEKSKKELVEKQQAVAEATRKFDEAKMAYEISKKQLDAMKLSVNELAETMRKGLQEGDTCPVCGQKVVAHLIPVEESLQNAYQLAKQMCDEAEQKKNDLESKKNGLNSELLGLTKGVEQLELTVKQGETEVEKSRQQAMIQLQMCGIENLETEVQLQERISAMNEKLNALTVQLKAGMDKEKRVGEMRNGVDALLKQRDKKVENNTQAMNKVKDCEGRINVIKTQQTQLQQDEAETVRQVNEWMVVSGWDHDWKVETTPFKEELIVKTKQYNSTVEQQKKLTAAVELMKSEISWSAAVQQEILNKCADWQSLLTEALPKEVKSLNNRWNSLQNSVVEILQKKQTAMKEQQGYADKLNQFMQEHPSLQRKRLESLGIITETMIEAKEAQLAKQKETVSKCMGEMDNCKKQHEKHLEERPELAENENVEALSVCVKNHEKNIGDLQQQKGVIQQIFKADEERKSQQAELLKKIELLQVDAVKWNTLKEFFGSADGSKFRTIAQSYILASLLESANVYMKTLSDRYTLKVQAGTFVIMLEDAYQGFAQRVASTLSGGESFLVSLSLALALSDIGQRLSVDTLFIDEGFGTLSGEPLNNAIETLRQLHSKGGRRVGIISHVEELKERIPVQIRVDRNGNNSYSEVSIVG